MLRVDTGRRSLVFSGDTGWHESLPDKVGRRGSLHLRVRVLRRGVRVPPVAPAPAARARALPLRRDPTHAPRQSGARERGARRASTRRTTGSCCRSDSLNAFGGHRHPEAHRARGAGRGRQVRRLAEARAVTQHGEGDRLERVARARRARRSSRPEPAPVARAARRAARGFFAPPPHTSQRSAGLAKNCSAERATLSTVSCARQANTSSALPPRASTASRAWPKNASPNSSWPVLLGGRRAKYGSRSQASTSSGMTLPALRARAVAVEALAPRRWPSAPRGRAARCPDPGRRPARGRDRGPAE